MNKPVFDPAYAAQLKRYNALFDMPTRTWRQQQELEWLNRQMDAHERITLRGLVNDYEEAMQLYEAGNLGTVEI